MSDLLLIDFDLFLSYCDEGASSGGVFDCLDFILVNIIYYFYVFHLHLAVDRRIRVTIENTFFSDIYYIFSTLYTCAYDLKMNRVGQYSKELS